MAASISRPFSVIARASLARSTEKPMLTICAMSASSLLVGLEAVVPDRGGLAAGVLEVGGLTRWEGDPAGDGCFPIKEFRASTESR